MDTEDMLGYLHPALFDSRTAPIWLQQKAPGDDREGGEYSGSQTEIYEGKGHDLPGDRFVGGKWASGAA
jgi:hypothetical protein